MKPTKFYRILFSLISIKLGKGSSNSEWDKIMENNDEDVSDETHTVEAVLGKTTNLPCDIESRDRQNVVYMVLWFRKNDDKPIYSFDARGRPAGKELHWSDERSLGPRAYFVTLSRPASLQVDNVQLRDEGTYRCRVDYQNAPTRNFQIHLTITVPPHQIILYDNSGREVQYQVGPIYEGGNLTLICEVRGGKPTPSVTWSTNTKILQNHTKPVDSNVVTSKLELKNLSRLHTNNIYTCTASNTKLILPSEKRVQLKLYLKPLKVQILQKYQEVIVNRTYTLTCETSGSQPPALIMWWKGETQLNPNSTKEYYSNVTGDTTINAIANVFRPQDNDVIMKCQAMNPKISKFTIEDSFKLNVHYPPIVSLHLGSKLDSNNIKESDDVYFECKNHANPLASKIVWFHKDRRVYQNVSSGIILSGQSLVLQGITRHYSGSYICQVSNSQGETTSNLVTLRVKYAPVCQTSKAQILGATLGDIVNVVCSVIADPPAISFKWIFNNSAQSSTVSPEKYVVINSTTSKLIYKLTSNRDFGTLTCWTRNIIGDQTKPCTFLVIKAVRPNAVTNCTFQIVTKEHNQLLEIRCLPGYNGGVAQTFHLEINRQNRTLWNFSTGELPHFYIQTSEFTEEWQSDLQFILYSSNLKGRSDYTIYKHKLPEEIQTKIVTELTMSEQMKDRNEVRTLSLIATFSFAMVASGLFLTIILIKKSGILKPQTNDTIKKKYNSKPNLDDNDEKYLISLQCESNKPDILNKVNENNYIRRTNQNEVVFSTSSLIDVETEADEVKKDLSRYNDKCPLFVTTSGSRNEKTIICKKIENEFTDAISGPESSV